MPNIFSENVDAKYIFRKFCCQIYFQEMLKPFFSENVDAKYLFQKMLMQKIVSENVDAKYIFRKSSSPPCLLSSLPRVGRSRPTGSLPRPTST